MKYPITPQMLLAAMMVGYTLKEADNPEAHSIIKELADLSPSVTTLLTLQKLAESEPAQKIAKVLKQWPEPVNGKV